MRRKEEFTGDIDFISILFYLILVGIGFAAIFSTISMQHPVISLSEPRSNADNQLRWILISGLFAFIILLVDSKFFSTFAYPILGILILFALSVIPFGTVIKGQQNWIRVGSFTMQPSELAKFGVVLGLSKYLSGLNVDLRKWKDKLYALGFIFVPLLLIAALGDAGTAIVFVALFLTLYREGLESYFLIVGASLIVLSLMALLVPEIWYLWLAFAVVACVLCYNFKKKREVIYAILMVTFACCVYVGLVSFIVSNLKPHQKTRINVLLGKETNKKYTYNVEQSKIAIGSGSWIGTGYMQGTQTKLDFVPEQSTDFIFSSIGEEFGFAGSSALILIFLGFLYRLLYLAERQRSRFSRVYGYSVASIFFFHFLINVGMVIGVVPVIGIPLPFISYGGSSLLAFTLLLFSFLRMDSQRFDVLK